MTDAPMNLTVIWTEADLAPTDVQVMRNEKVKALVEAFRKCINDLDLALRDGYDGVWSESDFAEQLEPYRAVLRDLEGGNG